MNHLVLGQAAETIACQYLEKQGLKLIQKNFRTALGEIDLVMSDPKDLIFVEVRCRKKHSMVPGIETVNLIKKRHLIKTAEIYLQKNPNYAKIPARFDVVAVTYDQVLGQHEIDWQRAAFIDEFGS